MAFRLDFIAHGDSHRGKWREENQDYYRIPDETTTQVGSAEIFLVADGIGGNLPHGQIASETAVKAFWSNFYLHGDSMPLHERVKLSLLQANEEVRNRAEREGVSTIGTTFVGLAAMPFMLHEGDEGAQNGGEGVIFNVGDSRVYRIRNGDLELLSRDQVRDNESGLLIDELDSKRQTRVTSYLGQPSELRPNISRIRLLPGDAIILCTDGVWSNVDASRLKKIVMENRVHHAVQLLRSEVLAGEATDNLTLVIVRVELRRGDDGTGTEEPELLGDDSVSTSEFDQAVREIDASAAKRATMQVLPVKPKSG